MLDHFTIFTKGGIVLWEYSAVPLKGTPVDSLVSNVLLEERAAETTFTADAYSVKWRLANDLELIFVAVYQKLLTLLYVDELLSLVQQAFTNIFSAQLQAQPRPVGVYTAFSGTFERCVVTAQERSAAQQAERQARGPKSYYETQRGKAKDSDRVGSTPKIAPSTPAPSAPAAPPEPPVAAEPAGGAHPQPLTDAEIADKLAKLGKKVPKAYQKKPTAGGGSNSNSSTNLGKQEQLDFSKDAGSAAVRVEPLSAFELDAWKHDDDEEKAKAGKGWLGYLASLAGVAELDAASVAPLLARFEEQLVAKNVAADIASQLCASVQQSLCGVRLGTFESLRGRVRAALEEALVRILTPRRATDVLRDASECKVRGEPYTVVFCGVNGVGKSTSLAKVAALLQQHGHSVMVAACDTFRSGAVEQLRTHAVRLGFALYERGYRSEPTQIALDAVRQARDSHTDVVLIDTAGRMQDNEPLMRALSKLVNTVRPHLVLFVGEALVGNDGVDQLTKFNQALLQSGGVAEARRLDGVLLTKFDTIDDQVGAALSMVYSSGLGIVFVGTGQHYTDLKRLSPSAVAASLLKGF